MSPQTHTFFFFIFYHKQISDRRHNEGVASGGESESEMRKNPRAAADGGERFESKETDDSNFLDGLHECYPLPSAPVAQISPLSFYTSTYIANEIDIYRKRAERNNAIR